MKKSFNRYPTLAGLAGFILVLVFTVTSCNRSGISELTSDQYDLDITSQPFSIVLKHHGETVLRQAVTTDGSSSDTSSFHFFTDEGRQGLASLLRVDTNKKSQFSAAYKTTDDRTASIEIKVLENGSFRVSFSVSPSEGIQQYGDVFHAFPNEHFVGLMERVKGEKDIDSQGPGDAALDLRGQKVRMFVNYTISLYSPYYISSKGYGVFVDGTWPGEYDMAASNEEEVCFRFEGDQLTYTLMPGPEIGTIMDRYTGMTGRPILPPKWIFSPWRWRDEHVHRDRLYDGTPYTGSVNSTVYEDVAMMEALDIPCSVYWIDRPWGVGPSGYDDFIWDKKRLPNVEKMIRWLDSKDIKFFIWIAPWLMGEMVDVAAERGYIMPGMEEQLRKVGKQRRVLLDFTNPEAVAWWQGYIREKVDQGVAGFKMDRSEEIVPSDVNLRVYDGRTTREVHNEYPLLYLKAVHDVFVESRGSDFACMPRAGYTGSTRYGIFWAGDTYGTEWGLRSVIISAQRSALLGFPVWGSDTGGYHRGGTREGNARWLSFSCFSPIMEVGPTFDRAYWDMPSEPHYDIELIAIWRLYAKLHEHIADYTYRYAQEAHESGHPIIRPLFYHHPGDEACWQIWDEFLFGEDYLVAPLWRKGQVERDVYLPEGEWRDYWTGEVFQGPQTITVSAPLYKMPLFLKAGSKEAVLDLEALYRESLEIASQKPVLTGPRFDTED